jgi:dienelactone hydrolase
MRKLTRRIAHSSNRLWKKAQENVLPGKKARKGATAGLFIAFAITLQASVLFMLPYLGWGPVLIMLLALSALMFISAALTVSLLRLLARIPFWLLVALLSGFPVIKLFLTPNPPGGFFIFTHIALTASLIGGALWLIRPRWARATLLRKILMGLCLVLGVSGFAGGLVWFLLPGCQVEMPPNAAMQAEKLPDTLALPNPALHGSFPVAFLSYGSGEDKQRPEYADEASIITQSVDGSNFLDSWKGFTGNLRTRYFGFDAKSLPLNARVWYPEGDGPFPLVLIVHGNHLAQDFSDPGYAYLGELMASRGYIMASVDQNFLNGSFTDFHKGLKNENDARGWLLLKHLQLWQQWNHEEGNLFYEKIDMDNIALIGHSRGGEAAAHAAFFNTLPFYPDNANEVFDFHFNIKSVIAIAPVDGQYQPARTRTPLRDVNYFVLQGSHDADLSSYMGMRQFRRTTFSDDFDGLKAGLYIWSANHGQFNSVWGNKDGSRPFINLFNLGQLLTMEDQQTIARVYISAFLETTLRGNRGYQPLFMDQRVGRHWLPETIYMSQYEQTGTRMIANFEEDINLATASLPGSTIQTADLSIWKEQTLPLQWGDYESRMVVLGWNTTQSDTLMPCYQISWPAGTLTIPNRPVLVFAMANTGDKADPPGKKKDGESGNNQNSETNENKENKKNENKKNEEQKEEEKDDDDEPQLIDFTIRLADESGTMLEFPLSQCAPLQPRLRRQLTKLKFMQTAAESENILQFFYFPLEEFAHAHPDFDFQQVESITFIFDRTPEGVVAINNIGFQ